MPIVWAIQSAQQMQQRGFGTAAWPNHRHKLSGVYVEADMIERDHGSLASAIYFGQVFDLHKRHRRSIRSVTLSQRSLSAFARRQKVLFGVVARRGEPLLQRCGIHEFQ